MKKWYILSIDENNNNYIDLPKINDGEYIIQLYGENKKLYK